MAAADSQVPPLEGGASSRADRHTNGSPPPPQSKRDKKRQMINDRLAALSEKFNRDRDVTYREQLQKIQIDTNLVMRIDPYLERPLDAIEAERQQSQSLTSEADQQGRAPGPTLLEMAGPNFNDWLREIEDLVEQRDTELTKQKVMPLSSTSVPPNYTVLITVSTPERIPDQSQRVQVATQIQDRHCPTRAQVAVTNTARSSDQRHHGQEAPP